MSLWVESEMVEPIQSWQGVGVACPEPSAAWPSPVVLNPSVPSTSSLCKGTHFNGLQFTVDKEKSE
jgi:hypothetical protein